MFISVAAIFFDTRWTKDISDADTPVHSFEVVLNVDIHQTNNSRVSYCFVQLQLQLQLQYKFV